MSFSRVLLISIPVQDVSRPPAAMPVLAACCEQVQAEYEFVDLNLHMHKTLDKQQVTGIVSDFAMGKISDHTRNKFFEVYKHLDETLQNFKPDLLAISIFTYESIPPGLLLLEFLNNRPDRENFSIVFGGLGVNSGDKNLLGDKTFAEHVLHNKLAEYVISGEGELSFVELLKGNTDYPGINNRPPQQITELDTLPTPNFRKISPHDYFYSFEAEVAMTGSRGCVRDCTFCDVASYWPKYIFRSGEKLADDMFKIWQQTQVQKFFFSDSLINGSLKGFRQLNRRLIELRKQHPEFRPHYSGQFICRPVNQMKYQDYVDMKLAGAENLVVGIEHFSRPVRDHMRKHFDNNDVDWHFATCAELGIQNTLLLLSGYLTETLTDHEINLEYLKKYQVLAQSQIITAINIAITGLQILKGAPLYNILHLEYPEEDYNNKMWIYPKNPDLTPRERARRATEIVYTAIDLGYNVLHIDQKVEILKLVHDNLKNQKIQKIYTILPQEQHILM